MTLVEAFVVDMLQRLDKQEAKLAAYLVLI